jgi:hypothetical protein
VRAPGPRGSGPRLPGPRASGPRTRRPPAPLQAEVAPHLEHAVMGAGAPPPAHGRAAGLAGSATSRRGHEAGSSATTARLGAPKEGNAMANQETGENRGHGHSGQGSGDPPGPNAMLGVWTCWVEAMSGSAGRGWADPAKPWWQMTNDDVLGGTLATGAKQLMTRWPRTRSCGPWTRCGTPTRCATSCPWTGRRSPERSARCGCAPSAGPTRPWPQRRS